jgi:7 transmembrane sweet-taste receptor of 3 GCPR
MGTVWAYRTRNIATEYNESRFIGLTIAAILQAWSMGIPVLIIVHGIPSGSFFVKAGLIVLTSGILLFFTYVPKVLFARKAAWLAKQPQRPARTFARNPDKLQSAESDDSPGNQGYQLPSPEERPTGKRHSLKIIHNPRVSIGRGRRYT